MLISEKSGSMHGPDQPGRLRVLFVGLICLLILFIASIAAYNIPDSTIKVRILPVVDKVVHPWFEQDWQLFAPTPSTSNSHIWVEVRYVESNGNSAELPEFEVQSAIEDLPAERPWLPTKQPGITLAAQERIASYEDQLRFIQGVPVANRTALHEGLDAKFHATFDALARFISKCVQDRYPNLRVKDFRIRFTDTGIVPFSERNSVRPVVPRERQDLETTWYPFTADIGR